MAPRENGTSLTTSNASQNGTSSMTTSKAFENGTSPPPPPSTTKPEPEPATVPSSRVRKVLNDASRDLDDADFILDFVMNPIKNCILQPAISIASAVIPPVAGILPFGDEITAFVLSVPVGVTKHGLYNVLHNTSAGRGALTSIREDAVGAYGSITDATRVKKKLVDDQARSTWISARGYIVSATVELVSDPNSRVAEWTEAADRLDAYMQATGIGQGLSRAMLSPRFLKNYRIVGGVQGVFDNVEIRRVKAAARLKSPVSLDRREIAKLMRYCTSAYGQEMMEAAELLSPRQEADAAVRTTTNGEKSSSNKVVVKSATLVGSEKLKRKVCEHVGIPPEYVRYFCMGHGGSMRLLRHYIAVDHELGAVVLVIRGTYSFSGWTIDFQEPFCGGTAHAGMADMADAILSNSKPEIMRALEECPDYRLIITGQSLGAGVASLLNILCHCDPDVGRRSIRCHSYGGPPVYFQETPSPVIDAAIGNHATYIHQEDCVAHLSVNSVNRVLSKLDAVDRQTKKMGLIDGALMAAGRKKPTEAVVNAVVFGDANVPSIPGGPRLIIPAAYAVWFAKEDGGAGGDDIKRKVNVVICDPKKIADLGVLISKDGMANHPPIVYEQVLNEVEKSGWDVLTDVGQLS